MRLFCLAFALCFVCGSVYADEELRALTAALTAAPAPKKCACTSPADCVCGEACECGACQAKPTPKDGDTWTDPNTGLVYHFDSKRQWWYTWVYTTPPPPVAQPPLLMQHLSFGGCRS